MGTIFVWGGKAISACMVFGAPCFPRNCVRDPPAAGMCSAFYKGTEGLGFFWGWWERMS